MKKTLTPDEFAALLAKHSIYVHDYSPRDEGVEEAGWFHCYVDVYEDDNGATADYWRAEAGRKGIPDDLEAQHALEEVTDDYAWTVEGRTCFQVWVQFAPGVDDEAEAQQFVTDERVTPEKLVV